MDLDQAAARARKAGVVSIIDNTFATPILQQPIAHGIDAVIHSATKYLGGHSESDGWGGGREKGIHRSRQGDVSYGGRHAKPWSRLSLGARDQNSGSARASVERKRTQTGASAAPAPESSARILPWPGG